ncbi:hypothetical protein Bca52824_083477 [Brassica carinata]|uniref:Uncharacterized protein n=1 Tax=Brassica carinata TaxID=52824 RepID=A0A8X7TV97_BRACI|nr:hypothetical protein Bca52824_083477 [Brassica carinata]
MRDLLMTRSRRLLREKYLKQHNVKDWLRVIAANNNRNLYELRDFNITENEAEENGYKND